jgi:hypothetical protein
MLRLILLSLALVVTSCPKPPPTMPPKPPQAPEDVGKLAPPPVSPSPEVRDAVQVDLSGGTIVARSASDAPLASPLVHMLLGARVVRRDVRALPGGGARHDTQPSRNHDFGNAAPLPSPHSEPATAPRRGAPDPSLPGALPTTTP